MWPTSNIGFAIGGDKVGWTRRSDGNVTVVARPSGCLNCSYVPRGHSVACHCNREARAGRCVAIYCHSWPRGCNTKARSCHRSPAGYFRVANPGSREVSLCQMEATRGHRLATACGRETVDCEAAAMGSECRAPSGGPAAMRNWKKPREFNATAGQCRPMNAVSRAPSARCSRIECPVPHVRRGNCLIARK